MQLSTIKYGPAYLIELLVPVSELPGRSRLRSADSFMLDVPRTKSSVGSRAYPSLVLGPGMTCLSVSELHQISRYSNASLRLTFLILLFVEQS